MLDCLLYHYLLSLFIHNTVTVIKSTLPEINIAIPAFAWLIFARYIFYLVTFSYLFLYTESVSYRWYIIKSWFFIHFSLLYLLIRDLRPFMVNVIINMVKLKSTVLLFVSIGSIYFFLSLFPFSLSFLVYFLMFHFISTTSLLTILSDYSTIYSTHLSLITVYL